MYLFMTLLFIIYHTKYFISSFDISILCELSLFHYMILIEWIFSKIYLIKSIIWLKNTFYLMFSQIIFYQLTNIK